MRVLVFPELKHLNVFDFFDLIAGQQARLLEFAKQSVAVHVVAREYLKLDLPRPVLKAPFAISDEPETGKEKAREG